MSTSLRTFQYGSLALLSLALGCSGGGEPTLTSGNAALGIAKFEMSDTAAKTSVVGLDDKGQEVARLDLVHGRFALTEHFQADYDTPEVDGRKLDVVIQGRKKLVYETAGYEPVLHMPAHPASETTLAAFLEDAHVKPILDRWQIGFEPSATAGGEIGYGAGGTTTGSSPFDCSYPATNCGTARGFTMNTCGGGTPADSAIRVSRTSPYSEYAITQCCPGSPAPANNWFAIKTCPNTGSGTQPSSCGSATAACKSCAGYPDAAPTQCVLTTVTGGVDYCYQTDTDETNCYNSYNGIGCSGGLPTNNMCSCSCPCYLGTYQCYLPF